MQTAHAWQRIAVTRFHDKEAMIRALIPKDAKVLDVGFWGQANMPDRSDWPHRIIASLTPHVWGIDIVYDETTLEHPERYARMSAEEFSLNEKFDVIIALDLIEHITNAGKFLDCAKKHLAPGGKLIISTPNTYNLFVMAGKLSRPEPPINSDHTAYYNRPTIAKLLEKCGWRVAQFGVIYTLGVPFRESMKKKILNAIYAVSSRFTDKFYETMVVVAEPNEPR